MFQPINTDELNGRQKEIYNFQKSAALLADYGFNCIKLDDDWNGADFLDHHFDGTTTLKVQLKARLTIDRKYAGQDLWMNFPRRGRFRFLVRGAYDSKAGNAHRPTGCRVHARPQLCQSHPVSRRQSGLPAWRLVYFCVLAYYGGVSNSDCRMPTRGQC